MKKAIIKVLGILSLSVVFGCQEEKSTEEMFTERIVVTGQVENYNDTVAKFSYYSFGFLDDLQSKEVKFDEEGSFKMILNSKNPMKGWFAFGQVPTTEKFTFTTTEGKDSIVQTGTNKHQMFYLYLEPGDSLNLKVDKENIEETLSFSGESVDNNIFVNHEEKKFNSYKDRYLRNWYNVANREPNDYKQSVDKLLQKKQQYLDSFVSARKLSSHLVSLYKYDYMGDAVSSKINYPTTHTSYNEGKKINLPKDYYNFLDDVNFDQKIRDHGIGYFYNLRSYLNKKYEFEKENLNKKIDFYEWAKTELPEDVRNEFMAYALGSDFSRRLYDEFGENSAYPEMARIVRDKYQHLEGMLEGNPAPEVTLEDLDGNEIALAELQGKYTYIDLWATWCGPCIKEIPSIQKLEKEYHGKNIQFVSISVDDEKDLDKWKRFVNEKNLTGIQLIADREADSIIKKTFNIKMIPRFIFLDPQGKIIDASAPFPSDPSLVEMFDKYSI